LSSALKSVNTEVAFLNNSCKSPKFVDTVRNRRVGKIEPFLINICAYPVWTCRYAGLASYTILVINKNQTLFIPVRGSCWTDCLAEGLSTVVAENWYEQPFDVGVLP
jgi:hypothetical protein